MSFSTEALTTFDHDGFDWDESIVDLASSPYWSRFWVLQVFYLAHVLSYFAAEVGPTGLISRNTFVTRRPCRLTVTLRTGPSAALPLVVRRHPNRFPKLLQLLHELSKIRKHMEVKILNGTITRILGAIGTWHWKCKKRPYLAEEVTAKRLAWCLTRKNWTIEDFRK